MNRRRRRLWIKKRTQLIQRTILLAGMGIIFFAVWWGGMMLWEFVFQTKTFEEIIADDVWWVMHVMPDQEYDQNPKANEIKRKTQETIESFVENHFDFTMSTGFWGTLRPPLTVVGTGPEQVLFLAPYRDEKQLHDITSVWGTWEKENPQHPIRFLESNSPNHAMAIYKDMVLFAKDKDIIQKGINLKTPLRDNSAYKQFAKSLSPKDISLYVQWDQWLETTPYQSIQIYYPLWKRIAEIFPAIGITTEIKDTGMETEALIISPLSWEEIGEKEYTPSISRWMPKDVLFGWSGYDAQSEYRFIEEYIQSDEQARLLWSSFWNDMADTWNIDINQWQDVFSNAYGVAIQERKEGDGIGYSFVLSHKPEKESLVTSLQTVQGRLTPSIEVIDLPNGSQREDLMAQAPQDIVWEEKQTQTGWTYKTAPESILQTVKVTFSEYETQWVISSQEELFLEMDSVIHNQASSLLDNVDFQTNRRNGSHKMKEWGFLNISKLKHQPFFEKENIKNRRWMQEIFDILNTNFRNATIGKENRKEGIFFRTIFLFGK